MPAVTIKPPHGQMPEPGAQLGRRTRPRAKRTLAFPFAFDCVSAVPRRRLRSGAWVRVGGPPPSPSLSNGIKPPFGRPRALGRAGGPAGGEAAEGRGGLRGLRHRHRHAGRLPGARGAAPPPGPGGLTDRRSLLPSAPAGWLGGQPAALLPTLQTPSPTFFARHGMASLRLFDFWRLESPGSGWQRSHSPLRQSASVRVVCAMGTEDSPTGVIGFRFRGPPSSCPQNLAQRGAENSRLFRPFGICLFHTSRTPSLLSAGALFWLSSRCGDRPPALVEHAEGSVVFPECSDPSGAKGCTPLQSREIPGIGDHRSVGPWPIIPHRIGRGLGLGVGRGRGSWGGGGWKRWRGEGRGGERRRGWDEGGGGGAPSPVADAFNARKPVKPVQFVDCYVVQRADGSWWGVEATGHPGPVWLGSGVAPSLPSASKPHTP